MTFKIKLLRDDAFIPTRAHATDAGLDLLTPDDFVLLAHSYQAIPMGIAIEVPEGYEAQVRPRSGLALKHGVTVLNAPGTIDSGFRGEVGVILINHGEIEVKFERGKAIAQLVLAKVELANFIEVDALNNTDRGKGGFGSTDSTL
jgi:dUTP pyrophosphatase